MSAPDVIWTSRRPNGLLHQPFSVKPNDIPVDELLEEWVHREDVDDLVQTLRTCRILFEELRSDWSDNRGPCRDGMEAIDKVLEGWM